MSTIVVQSNVSKLEDKQNYKIWNIQICSLLKFKDELAVIEYISRLKKTESIKNQKNTMKATLTIVKKLWKTEILLSDQQTATTDIVKTDSAAISLSTDSENDDDEDKKSADFWYYHKYNKKAVFMIISSLSNHILTKIQDIKSAKLIYDRFKKLYKMTTDLKSSCF